jgi:Ni,Fe-hydrogenase III component G
MNTEEILTLASGIAQSWDWATVISRPNPKQIDIKVNLVKELVPLIVAMRVKRLGHLSAITCLDLGSEVNEMEVLYHFCPGDAVIALRVRVPRQGAELPSLCEIIPGAESFERELREMFGIELIGLHTPDRLYLPDDWPDGVFPMLKDFDPIVLSTASKQGMDS